MKCVQSNCQNVGTFEFWWPGRDRDYICDAHVLWLVKVADACYVPAKLLKLKPIERG